MKKSFLTVVGLFLLHFIIQAQLIRAFTPRFSIDTKGRLVYVTNNIITTKQRAGGNAVAYTQAPPSCPAGSVLCKNDNEYNSNIDVDGDPSTFNSSSASLALPPCTTVEFAGLYWGAGAAISQGNNGLTPISTGGWDQVKFKVPGGVYQSVTANVVDTVNVTFYGYQSFADVTNVVRAAGAGSYTVANVKCDTVTTALQPIVNAYGGWNLVIIYRDSTQTLKNMTVFDGLAVVRNSPGFTSRDITFSGFKCPPTGVVSAKLGVVLYDGDRGAVDGFLMKQSGSTTFIDQTAAGESAAATSGSADAWNSSITDTGSLVTSRIPAHQNTYGYDAHIYKLANSTYKYLNNNDVSTTIRINTTSEGYVLGLVTSEIDTYEPEMILQNAIVNLNNPGAYNLGDTLLITSTIKNTGTDLATGVSAVDALPAYFKFVPGSITSQSLPMTDAAGDDAGTYDAGTRTVTVNVGAGSSAAGGGNLSANGTSIYTISYKLTISTNCADIGTTPIQLLQKSTLNYQGLVSATPSTAGSRPLSTNTCVNPVAPDTATLLTGCPLILPVKLISFNVVKTAAGNVAKWNIEEHNDGKSYEIQTSADGRNFTSIYTKNISLKEGLFTYTYADVASYNQPVIYYRLRIMSIDGTIAYSNIISVKNNNTVAAAISLSPNPVVADKVILNATTKVTLLQWYDVNGKLVLSVAQPADGQLISTGKIAKGIYYVKAYTSAEVITLKVIKQ